MENNMVKINNEEILTVLAGLPSIYLYLSGFGLYFRIAAYLSYIIYPLCYCFGIIAYLRIINSKRNIFIIIAFFVFFVINYIFNPHFSIFALDTTSIETLILSDIVMMIFISIPGFLLSRTKLDYKVLFEDFYKLGMIISTLFLFLFFIIVFIHKDPFDYMNITYGVLPWILYVMAHSLKNRDLLFIFVSIIDVFFIIISGCRGAFVTVFVFILLTSIWMLKQNFNYRKLIILCCVIVGVVILIININDIILALYYMLSRFGFKSRSLELVLGLGYETGIGHYSDRASFQKQMIEQINVFGHGIYSDRSMVFSGVYAHNILLEWLLDFGIIIGGVLSLLFVLLSLRNVIYMFQSDNFPLVIIIASCISILCCKYMVSSSYLHSPEFWIMFGLSTSIYGNNMKSIKKE